MADDAEIRALQDELADTRRSIRRLTIATTAFFTPILIGMMFLFFFSLDRATTELGKVAVFICGGIGFWWLQSAERAFDRVND